jgi:hypothetical protein
MQLWTSAAVDAQRLAEISPNAISPSRPWAIGLVTIVALSTLVAGIGIVVSGCVEVVQTVEMSDSLAQRTVLNLAVAGSLVQISVLSFVFAWEEYRHGVTTSSVGQATATAAQFDIDVRSEQTPGDRAAARAGQPAAAIDR